MEAKDEMNAENVACEHCGEVHPGEVCEEMRLADGGEVSNEGYDKEFEIPGSADEINQVLAEVIALTEDPDAEHEYIRDAVKDNEKTPSAEKPTLDRVKEVEAEPAPETHDEISSIVDDIKRQEDANKPHSYGMNRRR